MFLHPLLELSPTHEEVQQLQGSDTAPVQKCYKSLNLSGSWAQAQRQQLDSQDTQYHILLHLKNQSWTAALNKK